MSLKVSEMLPADALTGSELLAVVQNLENRQCTVADIILASVDIDATAELIRDTMGTALVAAGILTITVDDPGDTITLAVTTEAVQDLIGAFILAGEGIVVTYDDGANTSTVEIDEATAANIQAGTAGKVVTADELHSAHIPQVLTNASPTVWDMHNGFNAEWTMTGDHTLSVSNPAKGLTYMLAVIQDATGNRVASWPASFDWGTAGVPTQSTAADTVDIVSLYCYDAVTPLFRATFSRG